MEKIFIDALRPFLIDNPVLAVIIVGILAFLRLKIREYNGWITRLEKKMDSGFEAIRDGMREERQFRHDTVIRHDNLIHDISREVSEIRGRIGGKNEYTSRKN
jgi:hypothetical protein